MLSPSNRDDAAEHEFRGMIAGMNVDERADLLALLYLGRGDFTVQEWDDAVSLARQRDSQALHLGNYLVGTPNLPDLLGEGLAALGFSADDEDGDTGEDETVEIRHVPPRS
jgi:Protein of unknown function (DUF3775)